MSLFIELYIVLHLLLGAPLNTLVDGDHGLPRWYDPTLQEAASEAFVEMKDAADLDNVKLDIFSGYRSYAYQQEILQREFTFHPESADFYLAHPGHSEHQLGTAFDVIWPGLQVDSKDPRNLRAFDWLEMNAHIYGFVLSYPLKTIQVWPYDNRIYPLDGEFIYEPWHIRYVGADLAQEMVDAGYLDFQSPVVPQDFYQVWP
jgi:D-alanyl-D-alanine carboxypeptidase